MRRIAPLLAGILLATSSGVVSARAQEPQQVGGAGIQYALSVWLQEHRGERWLYFVVAGRGFGANTAYLDVGASAGGVIGYAAVGRAPCPVTQPLKKCSASGRIRALGTGGFSMDPLLQSAEMHLQKAGHEVYWTGDGDLTPRHEEHPAAAKLSGLVEVSRHALFEGAVFNEPIDTSHPTFSALFEYAEAIAVPTFVEFRNGTIHFR